MFFTTHPKWNSIKTIVFDFDGIFTDNKVYLNQDGEEFIQCNRSDGLAFNILKKFIKINNWQVDILVLTKEKNKAALKRCEKLGIRCINAVDDKASYLLENYSNQYDSSKEYLRDLIYLGNDLNDLQAVEKSQYSFAPMDAHELIKKKVNYVLPSKGGCGFVRAFIEILLRIDTMDTDMLYELIK